MKITLKILSVLLLLSISSTVNAYVIDGKLNDWGVTPGSDYTPRTGVFSWVEDYVDYSRSGYVGPGYGGQPYDFEALYATYDQTNLYIAMVMGMPPTGSGGVYSLGQTPDASSYYYPGDIALDLNGDGFFEYGMETTGISDNSPGGKDKNGAYTYNSALKGNLYKVLNTNGWNKGLSLSNYTEVELNYRQSNSLQLVCGNTIMYIASDIAEHYVVETSIPLSKLTYTAQSTWKIHWAQTCGNDIGELSFAYIPYVPNDETGFNNGSSVPEPTSMVLLGVAVSATLIRRLRKK